MSDATDTPLNEITAAAHDARRCREGAADTAEPGKAKSNRWPLATIGFGIGSAALGAAMLYATRGKRRRG
ncbi:MAG: hypothetical protein ACTHM0_02030 [Sphingomonas sp.]